MGGGGAGGRETDRYIDTPLICERKVPPTSAKETGVGGKGRGRGGGDRRTETRENERHGRWVFSELVHHAQDGVFIAK